MYVPYPQIRLIVKPFPIHPFSIPTPPKEKPHRGEVDMTSPDEAFYFGDNRRESESITRGES